MSVFQINASRGVLHDLPAPGVTRVQSFKKSATPARIQTSCGSLVGIDISPRSLSRSSEKYSGVSIAWSAWVQEK